MMKDQRGGLRLDVDDVARQATRQGERYKSTVVRDCHR